MKDSPTSFLGGIFGAFIGSAILYYWLLPPSAVPPYTPMLSGEQPVTVGAMEDACKWASLPLQKPDTHTDMRIQLLGFVCIGAVEASSHLLIDNGLDCEPVASASNTQQELKIVSDYITAHPEKHNFPLEQAITAALKQAWPCK